MIVVGELESGVRDALARFVEGHRQSLPILGRLRGKRWRRRGDPLVLERPSRFEDRRPGLCGARDTYMNGGRGEAVLVEQRLDLNRSESGILAPPFDFPE